MKKQVERSMGVIHSFLWCVIDADTGIGLTLGMSQARCYKKFCFTAYLYVIPPKKMKNPKGSRFSDAPSLPTVVYHHLLEKEEKIEQNGLSHMVGPYWAAL
jgi:hypothetical protein